MQKQTLEEKLNKALMDEYHARDTYRKIIDTFGEIRPFSNIVQAEQRHIDFLLPLYKKYSIAVPPEPDTTGMAVPATVAEAYKIAVQAERKISASMMSCLQAQTNKMFLLFFGDCRLPPEIITYQPFAAAWNGILWFREAMVQTAGDLEDVETWGKVADTVAAVGVALFNWNP